MKDLIEEYDIMQDFTSEMEEAYLLSDIMSYIKLNGYEQFRNKLNAKMEEHYMEQMASFLRYKEQSEQELH